MLCLGGSLSKLVGLRVRMFPRGKFGMCYLPIYYLRGRYTGHQQQNSDLRGMLYMRHPLLSFDLRGSLHMCYPIISDLRDRYIVFDCLRLREMFYLRGSSYKRRHLRRRKYPRSKRNKLVVLRGRKFPRYIE